MKLTLASRLDGVLESSTLKMNALAKDLQASGKKIINLTAGEPNFDINKEVKAEAIRAIQDNFSKYTAVSGIAELKNLIIKKFKSENELEYPEQNIVVTVGAKQAIFNFLLATLNAGDEVLIPAPYWVSYPEMVKLAGGVPKIIKTEERDRFKISVESLKKNITSKTKALILNSPSNPTGVLYSKEEFIQIAKVLEGTNIWVCSDEIYEKLVFDSKKTTSFASLSQDAFDRTVTINGFSKAYSMTGWRLGYCGCGNKDLAKAMVTIQGQSTSGAPSLVQKAAVKAMQLDAKEMRPMVEAMQRRKNLMCEIFSKNPNFSFVEPDGAFYLFLNVERVIQKTYNDQGVPISSSEILAFYLLEKIQVVTVPGIGFGAEGYLRLSFAVSDQDVLDGANKICELFK